MKNKTRTHKQKPRPIRKLRRLAAKGDRAAVVLVLEHDARRQRIASVIDASDNGTRAAKAKRRIKARHARRAD